MKVLAAYPIVGTSESGCTRVTGTVSLGVLIVALGGVRLTSMLELILRDAAAHCITVSARQSPMVIYFFIRNVVARVDGTRSVIRQVNRFLL